MRSPVISVNRAVWYTAIGFLACFFGLADDRASADDDNENVVELPPLIIYGKASSIEPEKARQELARNPSSTVLIQSEEIEKSRGYNLEDVLQFAPGVYFQSRGGSTDGKLNIRGTNLSSNLNTWGVTLLINGLPFNAADGFAQLESIELLAVDHIEVYKGAQAVKFGANSLGGAVNFVLKTGVNQSIVQVRGEGGSFGMYNSQLASGKTSKPFTLFGETAKSDYYLSLTSSGQDGFRTNSQQNATRFNGNFGLAINTRHQARLTIISAHINSGLPGPLTLSEMETNPRQAGAQLDVGGNPIVCDKAEPCRYTNDTQLHRIGLAYSYVGDEGGVLTVAPFYQYWKWNSRWTQVLDYTTQDTGADLRYTLSGTLFGQSHRWIIGTSPWYGQNPFNLYVNNLGNRGELLQKRFIKTLNLGSYVEDEIELRRGFKVIMGGRLDYSARNATVTDFAPPGTPVDERTGNRIFSALNPRGGFLLQTSPMGQLYGNVSRGYEAPINIQLMQPLNAQSMVPTGAFLDDVDAQRAWQFELGYRGTAREGDIAWDITAYDLEMHKEILVTALTIPGIGEVPTFRNAGASRHTGVEAGGSITVAKGLFANSSERSQDQLALRASYTWRRYRFLDDVFKVSNGVSVIDAKDGNTIPMIPVHWITGEMRYSHPIGWWIAPNIEWSPSGFFVDYNNTLRNPPFFIVNLKTGYTANNWTLFFEGRNLTNQNYAGTTFAGGVNGANASTSHVFLPSWPISFFGGISYQFS